MRARLFWLNVILVLGILSLGAAGCGPKIKGTDKYTAPAESNVTETGDYSACTDDALNAGQCSTAVNRYVTPTAGENINGVNGNLSATITAGYYDGSKACTMSDSNLVAGNIKGGVTIFGISGSSKVMDTTSGTAGAGDIASGKTAFVNGSQITGTAAAGADVTSWANAGSTTTAAGAIPTGIYDGTKQCMFTDANLTSGNICTTKSIFNVSGGAVCESGTTVNGATAGDIIQGKDAWNSSGTKITGTIVNQGTLDATAAFPGAGYYSATVNNVPVATQVCTGTTLFGTPGSANCGEIVYNSNAHRDMATAPITQTAETTTYAGTALPAGYRDVPTISKDDDGYTGGSVTYATRPTVNCGTSQATIAARIADCETQNGANATWDGTVKGNAGQGEWKLVVRSAANKEVWQDQRTGLLWSSLVTTSDNWCRAAGNADASDPSNYCNSTTYQPSYPTAQSRCAEVGPTAMMEAAGSGENWGSAVYSSAKGGLGKNTTPSVRWRLPTKYDYQTADNNGLRFVVPGQDNEWSASVYTYSRGGAWYFYSTYGVMHDNNRFSNIAVRCVGR